MGSVFVTIRLVAAAVLGVLIAISASDVWSRNHVLSWSMWAVVAVCAWLVVYHVYLLRKARSRR